MAKKTSSRKRVSATPALPPGELSHDQQALLKGDLKGLIRGKGGRTPAELQKMINAVLSAAASEMQISTPDRGPQNSRSGKSRKKDSPLSPAELLQEWESVADWLYDEADSDYLSDDLDERSQIDVLNFEPTGYIQATVSDHDETWTVELDIDFRSRTARIGCECSSDHACEHLGVLAGFILEQIENPNSPDSIIVASVLGPKLLLDRQNKVVQDSLKVLDAFTKVTPSFQVLDAESASTAPATRWIWNMATRFSREHAQLSVCPVLQQENKSGGWSKGREVRVETFLRSDQDSWTDLDHRMAALLKKASVTYGSIGESHLKPVLQLLAGQSVATLNRNPCHIEFRPFEVIVEEADQGIRLSCSPVKEFETRKAGSDSSNRLFLKGMRASAVVLDLQKDEVIAYETNHASSRMLDEMKLGGKIMPLEYRDELLNKLKRIRSNVAVVMPPSIGGEEHPETIQNVLLLQMKKAGFLDVTLCVRDSDQNLFHPGNGLSRRFSKVGGQPVQYIRDLVAETATAQSLAQQLKLDRFTSGSNWNWRVSQAEQIADLMGLAGDIAATGQLSIVWHKQTVSQFDVIGSLSPKNVQVKVSRQRDWFGLEGGCTIGDTEYSIKDLLNGMRGRRMSGLLEISPGKWATVTEELQKMLQRLSDVSTESRGRLQLDASAALTVSALEDAQIQMEADKAWQQCMKRVQVANEINPEPPAGLNCDLRDYQRQGFKWLCRLSEWGVGGILADDMGLGKTVQTLAVLLHRIESGPALVIAPTSLGFNWQKECERFAPALTPLLLREADRADLLQNVSEGQVVICSYGLALREAAQLKKVKWGTLILDEAQNVKNSNSKTAQQIRHFQADWRLALTGTPMENHLGELWSILHIIAPGVLGPWEQFRRRFATAIEKENNSERREALSRVIAPFILRRSKKEVLKDLPDRSEQNLFVDLSTEERQHYDRMRLAAIGELDELSEDNNQLSSDQRFRILKLLTRLRQLACHVGMVDDSWTGSSSKIEMLMERLAQLKERGHRTLVFSQFTTHLGLIRDACDCNGITYQYLDGQTTPKARQQRVEAFQNGTDDVFLISLKAGGTGLNLTAADYVIHMDPWWNPAVEDQATDRAHRIGQTRSVMVYRIIARGTIEEQILSLHEEKRGLVEGILSGTEAAGRMSTEELADLIRWGAEGKPQRAK